jgi:hypothetical protein
MTVDPIVVAIMDASQVLLANSTFAAPSLPLHGDALQSAFAQTIVCNKQTLCLD